MNSTVPARIAPARTAHQAFLDTVRAELSKLLSLRPMWLAALGTLIATVVLAYFLSNSLGITAESELGLGDGSAQFIDLGIVAIGWTQIGFFVLGVLATTSEYIGGQIRTTLTAIPSRGMQRLAATLALIAVVFPIAVVTALASIASALLETGISPSALDPALTMRIVLNTAAHLTLMAVLAAAVGSIIRKAIPAAAVFVVYLTILSPVLQASQYLYFLPDIAAYTLMYTSPPEGAPAAPIAWLTIIAWTAALYLPALWLFRRRDT
ncbi:hypothetical protein GCM10011490_05050 [Pseudoclavibacter endophyticus]|uniref:ABC transporter permease n=1 Tax=Pseudoclavibacter endophyticus TaxID=1778590 RepID=A0A6H9WPF4_9MICO|nr:hypothetical protein [Pseudoclavibacter endophyticus]KAB1649988.1 hypothetical protein F8O04_07165 [Pseudoclavibacter endophyticus]GGA58151.1 hypothetical protein GCM10011490_05050 [Pseudoclavibacter endophyticus]